jgi:hypothetical protein
MARKVEPSPRDIRAAARALSNFAEDDNTFGAVAEWLDRYARKLDQRANQGGGPARPLLHDGNDFTRD